MAETKEEFFQRQQLELQNPSSPVAVQESKEDFFASLDSITNLLGGGEENTEVANDN